MARNIFFSFHFARDAWRAGQVRNSDRISNEEERGFIDGVDWEEVKRKGEDNIKRWINEQLEGTSVTVVLIGAETSERPWVDYEIRESWKRGNAIIGLYIHDVKDPERKTDTKGANPLDSVYLVDGQPLSSVCRTYDWVADDGRAHLGEWADQAVIDRAEYKGETKLKDGVAKKSVTPPANPAMPTYAAPAIPRISSDTGFIPHSPHAEEQR